MQTALDKNILVISDLHLGEDLKPGVANVSYLRHLAKLERELESFLGHYTDNRLDGRPWRLVINGDMVDFMSIMILPVGEPGPDPEERQYGLGHGEVQSTAKLDRVFERHAGVFAKLAGFVAAGNELVIIVGNHDVEFHYPQVQHRFTDRLAEIARVAGMDNEVERAFRANIRFCPWFYYEESVVYVEHGHQYDEYCSFDYQLHPVEAARGIALSIAHAGIRYFSNLVPSLDPHCGETWGFADYMRWGAAHGVRGLVRLTYLYGALIAKLVQIWATLSDRKSDQQRGEQHRAAIRALAQQYAVAVDKLEALDRLHCVPVLKRFFRMLSAMFLDRIAIGMCLAIALGVSLVEAPGLWKLAAAGAVLAVGVSAIWILGRSRLLPSQFALRRAPEAILRIMSAPFVVFGHSHSTERVQLANGGVYYNTGTWADTTGREDFPHLIIQAGAVGSGPHAELRSWRGGASAPLESAK